MGILIWFYFYAELFVLINEICGSYLILNVKSEIPVYVLTSQYSTNSVTINTFIK